MANMYSVFRKYVLVFLCIQLNLSVCLAQFNNLETISTKQGLSQGMIFDIYQTKDGYLWFGTKNGLNRYDGNEFIIYNNEPNDSISISGSEVTSIFEDSRGLFWIGTKDFGLNIFDRTNQTFCKIIANDSIRLNSVWEIVESSSGAIILGTYPCNIVKIPSNQLDGLKIEGQLELKFEGLDQVTSIDTITEESMLYHDLSIYKTIRNEIIVGVSNGLFELDENAMQLSKIDLPKNNFSEEVLCITENEKGILIIARREEVLVFNNNKWESISLKMGESGGGGFKVRNIFVWKDRLIASGHGFGFEIDLLSYETRRIGNLNNKIITKVIKDDSGTVWFGTNGVGLLKYSETKSSIESHFSNESIWDFYPYNDSLLWVELAKEALLYNFLDKKVEFSSPNFSYVRDLTVDEDGRVWLLKRETSGEISIYNLDTEYKLKNKISLSCKSNLKSSLICDDSDILVSGKECELSKLNTSTKLEEVYSYSHLFGTKARDVISNYVIKSNADGKFWIALNKGLVSCFFENGQLNCEKHNEAHIHYLLEDLDEPNKYIWAGTKNLGLLKIDKSTGKITSYSKKDGLLDNEIYALAFDSTNTSIWLSTNRGISQLNMSTYDISNFSSEDGFQGPEFNSGAVFTDKNGHLFFGSVNGFSRFDPSKIVDSDYEPKTVITHLEINGHSRDILLSHENVELNYDENILTFHFASLDYTSPSKNTYKYRIKGMSTEWSDIGNIRSATFGQMSPGNYVFQVMGSNRSNVYGNNYASFSFHINPPFWRTMWAYLFYGLILLSSIYYFFQSRIRKYEIQKELEYNKRETKRLEQIEQIKSNFFSNITHELRTPLTLIIEPIRQILENNVDENIQSKLTLVGKSSVKLLNLVNSLLDIAKIESQVMKPSWSVGNIETHILNVIDSFQVLADQKNIEIKYESRILNTQLIYDLEYFEKIFTNVFGNAIKYTDEGSIEVQCQESTLNDIDYIEIIVQDTGIGILEGEIDMVFDRFQRLETNNTYGGTGLGLALAKELVELMDGSILISSKKNEGTQVTIKLPWKYTESKIIERNIPNIRNYNSYFESTKTEASKNALSSAKPLVLVVEDNDELRDFLVSALQVEYKTLEARNGMEGMEKALEAIPDLIISDIKMPVMEGIDMCVKLKSNSSTSHIPVILLTAKSSLDSRLEGIDVGADVYLTKPFSVKEVRSYIQSLLKQREMLWQYFESKQPYDGKESLKTQSIEEEFIDNIKKIIDTHMSNENLDVNLVLKEAGVSRTHLHRKLKALTGQSITEFIRNRRLNKAIELLKENSGEDISQIAYTVGFNNQSYFSTKFKEKFGISPSQILNSGH